MIPAEPLASLDVEAKLHRGLGDPSRLALLRELRHGPLTAGQLGRLCGLPAPKASNHLGCLLECGLVTLEVRGRHNVYALAHPAIARLLDASAAVSAQVGPFIEACRNYGPPSRRALRTAPGAGAPGGGRSVVPPARDRSALDSTRRHPAP